MQEPRQSRGRYESTLFAETYVSGIRDCWCPGFVALLMLLAAPVLAAQSADATTSAVQPAATGVSQRLGAPQPENPFSGSVPSGKAATETLALSLEDAVHRGLRQNLAALLSAQGITAARGRRWQALSELLPRVSASTALAVRQVDVKATIGIGIPNVPPVIGPFGISDARAHVSQTIFDWQSIERSRSASQETKAASFSYENARELVVLATASSYLLAVSDEAQVKTADVQRQTADALYRQAVDQKKAGVAAAIDVLRAQVELQSRERDLIAAQNELSKQKLVLARVIGLPTGQEFALTTEVPYHPPASIDLHDALQRAYASRSDHREAQARVRAAELSRQAAAAERYPSVGVEADYGAIGPNPSNSHGTVDAAAVLRIPIFQGGRIHGDKLQADAALTDARSRVQDVLGRIDQEVRDALFDLQSDSQQVEVAERSVNLADQTLLQARDRFRSGVTDNIEVVQAQESVSTANESLISSLYRYNLAKISLARAMGIAESRLDQFIKGN